MDDVLTNVTKYTGQTKAEVEAMNEDFKQMDTRTSREQLNDLAGVAGRLGITGKQAIEEFVSGADTINVALGDDLGDGAVDKIGKLAQMFGEDKTKGLRGAMLATGSAVNDLAQSSSANAGYIVDFTADLSGVGIQAKMSQSQIMGFASALDQNMQEESTASTVFSQLITKMYQDPARFAKIAGMQVKEFTHLMKTDANSGLIKFLEAMKSKGGFDSMAPLFQEMKLDGTRAVGVLSSVATHIDQVKEAQKTAAASYAAGTSVVQEFNTQNSSVQAQLDKAKKQFLDLSIDLGQKLMPVARYAISTTSLGIKALSTLITFTFNHYRAIIILSLAIVGITALYKAKTIATKADAAATAIHSAIMKAHVVASNLLRGALLALQGTYILCTRGIQGLVAWMRLMKLESMANPYAALATILLTVGIAIYALISKVKTLSVETQKSMIEARKHAAALKDMAEAHKKVGQSTEEEVTKINRLTDIIHSNSFSIDERRRAIAALQKIVPNYHANLTQEGVLHEKNAQSIKDHISELEDLAMAEALYDKMKTIQGDKYDAYTKLRKKKFNVESVNNELSKDPKKYNETITTTSGNPYSGFVQTTMPTEANRKKHRELEIQKKSEKNAQDEYDIQISREKDIKTYLKTHKKVSKHYNDIVMGNTNNGDVDYSNNKINLDTSPGSGKNGGGSGTDNKYDAAIKAAEEAYKKEKLNLSKSLQQKIITQDQFDDESYKKNINFLSKKISIEKQFGKSSVDTEQEMTNAITAETDRRVKLQQDKMNEELRQRDLSYDAKQMALKNNLIDGKITQEDYDKSMNDAERVYHQDRLGIIQKYGGDEIAEQKTLLDIKYNDWKSEQEKEKADKEKLKDEEQKKFDKSTNVDEQSAINEFMYQHQLESYEDYEQKKVDIAQKKADQRKQIEQALQDGISNILSSATSYFSAASQAEQAEVSAKYDKEIEAAGSNSAKGKKLEEKKQKELAAIKSKYNKKAMVIEVAQAIAQTAQNAISAYGAMAKIPVVGPALGIAAAAMATAAGMMQIATIKKQHQAESSGYYSGGYTGGSSYHESAGIVHQGEFVANHNAVANPQLVPVFNLIDRAQRLNRVGSLTAADVSRSIGAGGSVSQTVVNVPDTSEAVSQAAVATDRSAAATERSVAATERLSQQLDRGIVAVVSIDGRDGVANKMKEYNKLINNK
jgi:TP901 family phage tail tape measure protein